MAKGHKRHFIREKEAKAILQEASEKLKKDLETVFGSKVNMELTETDFCKTFLINGKPSLFKIGKNIYPTLIFEEVLASMPKIVVDMGAVRHICNGANVMAPGVVSCEGNFGEGDLVVVIDEKHRKPIAVGEVLYNNNIISKIRQGVVVRNVHFVGDKVWKLIKEMGFQHS